MDRINSLDAIVTPLLSIFFVLLSCGILGGGINFYLATSSAEESRLKLYQHIIIGIGAAYMVPLFLNMISSNLIDEIMGKGGVAPDYMRLLVLAGFCLVASISSRAFITSMTDRVLQEAKKEAREAKAQAMEAKQEASQARQVATSFIEEEFEPDEKEKLTVARSMRAQADVPNLTVEQQRVLRAIKNGAFRWRTISGISRDIQIDPRQVEAVLNELDTQGFIDTRTTSSGDIKWGLSAVGRVATRVL